jgi:mRNA interferase MazF
MDTPIFERGDIVRVPFPYADRATVHHRPAIVVATGLGLDGIIVWVAMITAAANRRWPGDVVVADHLTAGLPIPSLVRTSKIAAIAARRAERRGRLAEDDMAIIDAEIAAALQPNRRGFHE